MTESFTNADGSRLFNVARKDIDWEAASDRGDIVDVFLGDNDEALISCEYFIDWVQDHDAEEDLMRVRFAHFNPYHGRGWEVVESLCERMSFAQMVEGFKQNLRSDKSSRPDLSGYCQDDAEREVLKNWESDS